MAWLRNSLWPNLSDCVRRNEAKDIHIFEIGKVFGRNQVGTSEHLSLGVLSAGALNLLNRQGQPGPEADFFTLKGAITSALQSIGVSVAVHPMVSGKEDHRLHPTRQGSLTSKGRIIGLLGQIHPDVAHATDLPLGTILAEINLSEVLLAEDELQILPISRNPAVRRDIALLIDKSVAYERLEDAIVKSAGEVLEKHWLFDIYNGPNLPEGQHSLGIALQLRKQGENFTDEQANQVRETVVLALAKLGGSTR